MSRFLLPLSIASGLAVAWVDSRPTWDDTGMTAGALVLLGGLFGLLAPRRAWLWALAIGIWIPLHAILTRREYAMLVVLVLPFLGAYAGFGIRRLQAAGTGTG